MFPEVREAMRQDRALVAAFVTAECRLLEDMGVHPSAVNKIRNDLELAVARILTDQTVSNREQSRYELENLSDLLGRQLSRVQGDAEHREQIKKLRGVLLALGGGVVVISNALVGTGAAPVTGGLSVAGAALSGAVGEEMISAGVRGAFE
jgi:hypothetical protein